MRWWQPGSGPACSVYVQQAAAPLKLSAAPLSNQQRRCASTLLYREESLYRFASRQKQLRSGSPDGVQSSLRRENKPEEAQAACEAEIWATTGEKTPPGRSRSSREPAPAARRTPPPLRPAAPRPPPVFARGPAETQKRSTERVTARDARKARHRPQEYEAGETNKSDRSRQCSRAAHFSPCARHGHRRLHGELSEHLVNLGGTEEPGARASARQKTRRSKGGAGEGTMRLGFLVSHLKLRLRFQIFGVQGGRHRVIHHLANHPSLRAGPRAGRKSKLGPRGRTPLR